MTEFVIKEPPWEDEYDDVGNKISNKPKDGDFRWKVYSILKHKRFGANKYLKNQTWLERYDAKASKWKRIPVEYDAHYV